MSDREVEANFKNCWNCSYYLKCTTRLFLIWLIISAIACLIYALVIFGALVNKTIVSETQLPEFLPLIIKPVQYDASLVFHLTPTLLNKSFSGIVDIEFRTKDATRKIFLHCGNNLRIDKVSLRSTGGEENVPEIGSYDQNNQVQALLLNDGFYLENNSTYFMTIDFEGELVENDYGPLYGSYSNEENEERYYMILGRPTTKDDGLRFMFPCMDSPEFPAIFNLNVRHSADLRALSNVKSQIQQLSSDREILSLFNSTLIFESSQVSLALIDIGLSPEIINDNLLVINKYYRQHTLQLISTKRIIQFMSKSSTNIGKLDVLSIPEIPTIQQPGITFLNEYDVHNENHDLGLNN